MRADRLLSLLMFLQNRGRATTNRLAEELEVSRRTVIRDLYALRVAGFPVYTERGPHGGVYLHEDFRMKLTDLTIDELEALFTLSVPAALSDLGMEAEARGALLKLAASLPAARRNVERDVRSRIYLDPDPWRASRKAVPTLAVLRQATWEDRRVFATFLRARQVRIEREIDPYGLIAKGKSWYVVWAGEDGKVRVDNATAVTDAVLLEESFTRPAEFDLAGFWTTWSASHEANRPVFEVCLRALPEVLPLIERDAHRPIEPVRPSDVGERVEAIAVFDSFEQARGALLACGGAAEVIEPEALRLSVEDYARQTLRAYRAQDMSKGNRPPEPGRAR